MTGYRAVTGPIRDEAKKWQDKAEETEPIIQAVRDAYLSPTAFFVGDLMTLVPGAANAALEAKYYEEFRAFMERILQEAAAEFHQIHNSLRLIADEYERTDGMNEVDINKAYGS
ncbi:hypothetical protein LZ318_05690 [Saccharopolyspora indica]|uniref:hypothetical protein n=1 Tax=Saccharopolyspora indica TaxID=1229659 RepID=UPI0022EA7456|nr:hypothetical protein [Saccharopolyspora indica]MDA3646049.1 hypothetical protein [Saccharopolyspora indica]